MIDWRALDNIPHIAYLPQESSCIWRSFLSLRGVYMPDSLRSWKERLDPEPQSLPPSVFIDPSPGDAAQLRTIYGFPDLDISWLPDEPDLSRMLAEAIHKSVPGLIAQSQIATAISQRAFGAQVIVLLILDGLAYEDVLDWRFPESWRCSRRPCLVDGLSITNAAMPRIVGAPPLTHRLFRQGFRHRLGFTYWDRDTNDLTDILFEEFPSGQLTRVSEFAEILQQLSVSRFDTPTYVQIIRNGLDQFCHGYRERPDINHFLRELETSVLCLLDTLAALKCITRVYVTADHGILWHSQQNVISLPNRVQSARYVDRAVETGDFESLMADVAGCYSCLVGPHTLARARRVNEWGFHGGISGRESLIPFLELEYRP